MTYIRHFSIVVGNRACGISFAGDILLIKSSQFLNRHKENNRFVLNGKETCFSLVMFSFSFLPSLSLLKEVVDSSISGCLPIVFQQHPHYVQQQRAHRLTTWGAVGAQTSAEKLVSFPPPAVVVSVSQLHCFYWCHQGSILLIFQRGNIF